MRGKAKFGVHSWHKSGECESVYNTNQPRMWASVNHGEKMCRHIWGVFGANSPRNAEMCRSNLEFV